MYRAIAFAVQYKGAQSVARAEARSATVLITLMLDFLFFGGTSPCGSAALAARYTAHRATRGA